VTRRPPVCGIDDCQQPATVVLGDLAGGRLPVCASHHAEALARSGGAVRGVDVVTHTSGRRR
jgi:hypothetical protein